MTASRLLVLRDLRRRWRGWVLVVVVTALAGGVVLTAFAGARRTESAYPRFLEWSHPSDMLVAPQGSGLDGYDQAVGRLPEVVGAAPVVGINALPLTPDGQLDGDATVGAPFDAEYLRHIDRPKILAGRLPRTDRPDEVTVDVMAAQHLHLHIGSILNLGAVAGDGPSPSNPIRRLRERVVGVVAMRSNIVPTTDSDQFGNVYTSASLLYGLGTNWRSFQAFDGTYVRLRPGTSRAEFTRTVQRLAQKFPATGGSVFVADENQQAAGVEQAIRPEAIALALFGLIAGLTTLLIVAQLVARQLSSGAADYSVMKALGMTRAQLAVTGLAEACLVVLVGGLLASVIAALASPLMPIGPARLAEPNPGVSIDLFVLGIGLVCFVGVVAALVAWPVWRLSTRRPQARAPEVGIHDSQTPLRRLLESPGVPLVASIGIRGGLTPGQGSRAVPVRSGIIGAALSLAMVIATLTFGANFLRLVDTPVLYGQTWDTAVDVQFSQIPDSIIHELANRRGVAALTLGVHGNVEIGGRVIPAVGFAPRIGPLVAPGMLEGRAPRRVNEIALGTSTLRELGLHIGDRTNVTTSGRRSMMRIVGRAVFPQFGLGSFTATDLGEGALLAAGSLSPSPNEAHQIALVRFAAGNRHDANMAAAERSLTGYCRTVDQSTCLVPNNRPSNISDLARVARVPLVLAGVLALVGVALLAQLVTLFCRRRRRDFAILKTMGMLRRQVLGIVSWQTTTLATASLVIGIPLGVALGRWIWALFANSVGVASASVVPLWTILLILLALVAIANAVALLPAWRSASCRAGRELLAE